MALIRYPGSKSKLRHSLVRLFPHEMTFELLSAATEWEYREPFFGAGAVGFEVLRRLSSNCSIWLNDKDSGIVALWQAVKEYPDKLCQYINAFTPTVDAFNGLKKHDGCEESCCSKLSVARLGFRKLALHRLSYSGLGVKSGGPLGGQKQQSNYSVDCRWRPEVLCAAVWRYHSLLGRFERLRITCGDFGPVIADAPRQSFIYCDPPYFVKGGELYKHSLTNDDHARLAKTIRATNAQWCVSYDDQPEIRELYSGCVFHSLQLTYTTAHNRTSRPKNHELAIVPLFPGSLTNLLPIPTEPSAAHVAESSRLAGPSD